MERVIKRLGHCVAILEALEKEKKEKKKRKKKSLTRGHHVTKVRFSAPFGYRQALADTLCPLLRSRAVDQLPPVRQKRRLIFGNHRKRR